MQLSNMPVARVVVCLIFFCVSFQENAKVLEADMHWIDEIFYDVVPKGAAVLFYAVLCCVVLLGSVSAPMSDFYG